MYCISHATQVRVFMCFVVRLKIFKNQTFSWVVILISVVVKGRKQTDPRVCSLWYSNPGCLSVGAVDV